MRAVAIIDQPANYLSVQLSRIHQRPSQLRRKGYDDSDASSNHFEASYSGAARGGSNPRPSRWQRDALPLS